VKAKVRKIKENRERKRKRVTKTEAQRECKVKKGV
jgi:hypothetical protein